MFNKSVKNNKNNHAVKLNVQLNCKAIPSGNPQG